MIGKRRLESGEYRVWDMAAGSGNLEFTLPAAVLPYTYISTIGEEDAMYCRRVFPYSTVFTYDYLNDDAELLFEKRRRQRLAESTFNPDYGDNPMRSALLSLDERNEEKEKLSAGAPEEEKPWKMPENLRKDLENPKLKWLIFINPPFATSNTTSLTQGKTSKTGVSDTAVRKEMLARWLGETGRELFSQFLFRISEEFARKPGYLGLFSTLKYLNAPNDEKLREQAFRYTAERGFLFSSENFAGSKGKFPVAFIVWNLAKEKPIEKQRLCLDVFNMQAEKVGVKKVETGAFKPVSFWVKRPKTT